MTGQSILSSIQSGTATCPLSASVTPPVGPSTYQWDVRNIASADPFKDYVCTTSLGERYALQRTDLTQAALPFYTNKTASGWIVCGLTYTLPSDPNRHFSFGAGMPGFSAVSAPADLVRPTFDPSTGWTVNDGKVEMDPSGASDFGFYADPNASPPSTAGQQWKNVQWTVPYFGQVGEGCFCQLLNADRNIWRLTDQSHRSHFIKDPYNALQTLDIALPYPFNGQWDVSAKGQGVDNPAQTVAYNPNDGGGTSWTKVTASDKMETWAMYMPPAKNGRPTVWIPIAHYTWHWQGTWDPAHGLTGGSGGRDLDPMESFTPPVWTMCTPYGFSFIGVP